MGGVFALLALLLLAGCGGGRSGSSAPASRGRATIAVKWPASTARLIPNVSRSLVVQLKRSGTVCGSMTLDRPASTASFSNLPYGNLDVSVGVYDGTGGAGTLVATGAGTMVVSEDAPGTAAVATGSTVASLAVVPSSPTVVPGGTVALTASAKDASGAIVPLASGAGSEPIAWDATPAAVATVEGTTASAILHAAAPGTATVTARFRVKDTGETVAGSASVVVAPVPTGLAVGGWPVGGGGYGAAGAGRGPAAAGTRVADLDLGSIPNPQTQVHAVVGPDGTLYAASPTQFVARGAVSWSLANDANPNGLALTADGTLLVSLATRVEARNAATGALRWSVPVSSSVAATVGRDGTVFAGTASGTLAALDGATGATIWTASLPGLQGRLAVGDDGTVYCRTATTYNALNPGTGARLWSVSPDTTISDFAVVGDTLYAEAGHVNPGGGGIFGGRATGVTNVVALNAASGATRWSYQMTSGSDLSVVDGAVAVRSGRVYAPALGVVVALDAATGARVWSVRVPSASDLTTAGDGAVYVVSNNGAALEALEPATGAVRWTVDLSSPAAFGPPAIADDGTLYVPGAVPTRCVIHTIR